MRWQPLLFKAPAEGNRQERETQNGLLGGQCPATLHFVSILLDQASRRSGSNSVTPVSSRRREAVTPWVSHLEYSKAPTSQSACTPAQSCPTADTARLRKKWATTHRSLCQTQPASLEGATRLSDAETVASKPEIPSLLRLHKPGLKRRVCCWHTNLGLLEATKDEMSN